MTTLESLYENLVQSQKHPWQAHSEDTRLYWQARSVLADWFEEAGESAAAACLRWVTRNRRQPGFHPRPSIYGPFLWVRDEEHPIIADPPAHLPEKLWVALKDNDETEAVASFKSYRT